MAESPLLAIIKVGKLVSFVEIWVKHNLFIKNWFGKVNT